MDRAHTRPHSPQGEKFGVEGQRGPRSSPDSPPHTAPRIRISTCGQQEKIAWESEGSGVEMEVEQMLLSLVVDWSHVWFRWKNSGSQRGRCEVDASGRDNRDNLLIHGLIWRDTAGLPLQAALYLACLTSACASGTVGLHRSNSCLEVIR